VATLRQLGAGRQAAVAAAVATGYDRGGLFNDDRAADAWATSVDAVERDRRHSPGWRGTGSCNTGTTGSEFEGSELGPRPCSY
jgi:hypothetical protein